MKKIIIIVTPIVIAVFLIVTTGILFSSYNNECYTIKKDGIGKQCIIITNWWDERVYITTPTQNIACDVICEYQKTTEQENLKSESIEFSQGQIKLDDLFLDVQIADNDLKRMRGLMFQEQLPFDKGMLFVFDKPDLYSIWMPNMKFYLDIIWFDNAGNVVHIQKNIMPCQTVLEIQTCPIISPNIDSRYILEVTSGFVDKFNITKDSKFSWVLPDTLYVP